MATTTDGRFFSLFRVSGGSFTEGVPTGGGVSSIFFWRKSVPAPYAEVRPGGRGMMWTPWRRSRGSGRSAGRCLTARMSPVWPCPRATIWCGGECFCYICFYTFIYIYICVHMYVYMSIYTYVCICIYRHCRKYTNNKFCLMKKVFICIRYFSVLILQFFLLCVFLCVLCVVNFPIFF